MTTQTNPLTKMLNTLQETKYDVGVASSHMHSLQQLQQAYKDGKISQTDCMERTFALVNETADILQKYNNNNY